MISYFLLMHIGSSEGITLLEFEEEPEEQQEAPQDIALEGEEQTLEDLPSAQTIGQLLLSKASPGAF